MAFTKSLKIYYFGVCILLFIIIYASGCMEEVNITPANPSVETTPPVISTIPFSFTPAPTQTLNSCPIPKLVFNNSQKITKLGGGIRFTLDNTLSSSKPGTVPYLGVVYHDSGFTRIFDSTGKQILFVNDSDSMEFIPAGYSVPATYVINLDSVSVATQYEGNNITSVYLQGGDICLATIIQGPGAFKPPAIPPH